MALPAVAVALAGGAWRAWRAPAAAAAPSLRGPLRLREAVVVTLLLSAVSLAVGWAQQRFGEAGLLAGAAIGALADAHSSIAALGALHAAGRADTGAVLLGVGVAVATNALTRTATAFVAGGVAYGARVGASLAASTGVAWAVLLIR